MPRDGVPKKRKKYLGPESDFYDELKGQQVIVDFNTSPHRRPIVVRLDWVDRYTIGLRDTSNGRRFMLFKKSIHSLEKYEGDEDGAATTA